MEEEDAVLVTLAVAAVAIPRIRDIPPSLRPDGAVWEATRDVAAVVVLLVVRDDTAIRQHEEDGDGAAVTLTVRVEVLEVEEVVVELLIAVLLLLLLADTEIVWIGMIVFRPWTMRLAANLDRAFPTWRPPTWGAAAMDACHPTRHRIWEEEVEEPVVPDCNDRLLRNLETHRHMASKTSMVPTMPKDAGVRNILPSIRMTLRG